VPGFVAQNSAMGLRSSSSPTIKLRLKVFKDGKVSTFIFEKWWTYRKKENIRSLKKVEHLLLVNAFEIAPLWAFK
jgi:hypothetical protein